jgi:hypothetical protein
MIKMDTMAAFAMGQANRGKEPKVFDWIKAAQLIVEKNPEVAVAGLMGDWNPTADTIYEDGVPKLDASAYLSSTWATPMIDLDGEIIPCYRLQSEIPDWDSETNWPVEALAILEQSKK